MENYDMSQSNAEAFKTLKVNKSENSKDEKKHENVKENHGCIVVYQNKFGQCPTKEAKCKIFPKISHCL